MVTVDTETRMRQDTCEVNSDKIYSNVTGKSRKIKKLWQRYLNQLNVKMRCLDDMFQDDLWESISFFMANVHQSVNEISQVYLANERRYNYTTPKSFLEQIKLYRNLYEYNSNDLVAKTVRLENGLEKLKSTTQQVDDLKSKLAAQEKELAIKNDEANKLIAVVGAETEKVAGEKAFADEEAKKVKVIADDVGKKQKVCEAELSKAEPALAAAKEALDTLNKVRLLNL